MASVSKREWTHNGIKKSAWVVRYTDLGGVRREPVDEALLLGEHRLLARVRRFPVGFADGTLALVEVVVAGVDGDFAGVDLRDFRHRAVQELAVVRRHEERARQRLQKPFEPSALLDIVRHVVEAKSK